MAGEVQTAPPPSEPRRSLAVGAALLTLLRISALGSNAVVSVIVARLLGPSGSGRFAIAAGVLAFLSVLSGLGLENGATWMVSGRRWSARSAFATTQVAALALGCAGGLVGLGIYEAAADSLFGGLGLGLAVLVAIGVPGALGMVYASQVALALERYEPAVLIPAALAGGYIAGVAALAAVWGLPGAVGGLLAGQAAGWAAGLWWGVRGGLVGGAVDRERLRAALRFGFTVYLANLLAVLMLRFDLFVLNASTSAKVVGYYAVAIAVTNPLWLVPAALGSALFPRSASFAAPEAEDREHVETKALRHAVLLLAAGAVVLAIVLLVLLEPIYGARFHRALEPALLLLPGGVATGLATIFTASLMGRGRPAYVLGGALASTAIAIGLYLAFVPIYKANGAAVASTVSYLVNALVLGALLQRLSGRPTLPRLVPGRAELRDYRSLAARVRARWP